MESKLKHQVIGAIVLLILTVLILPNILDGKKIERPQNTASIPIQPNINEIEFKQPKAPQEIEPQIGSAYIEDLPTTPIADQPPQIIPEPQIAAKPESQTTANLNQFKNQAWVLQLGVFNEPANVLNLLKKLHNAGYTAFTKPAKPLKNQPTWLYVGPDLNKDKLTSHIPELKKLVKLQAVIHRYNPNK